MFNKIIITFALFDLLILLVHYYFYMRENQSSFWTLSSLCSKSEYILKIHDHFTVLPQLVSQKLNIEPQVPKIKEFQ